MAYSYIEYTANSSANGGKDYTYSFGSVAHDTANIKVNIGGTNLATNLYTVTQGTITLSAAPGSGSAPLDSALSATNIMRIFRQTNRTTAEVTFSSASVLQDSDLNTANDQARFLALEAVDRSNESITIDESDPGRYSVQVDGQDKRIFGVATPIATNDAVPKSYADTILNSTKSHRDDALDHKDTAADYAGRTGAVVRLFDGATDNTSDTSPADQSGVYSAKEHAIGDLTASGGSSKAWAIDSSSPDGSGEKSSKTLAAEAAASATAALASENAANASASAAAQVFDKFDDKYLGQMADGASATNASTNGTWAKNSSVITVASATNIEVGQEVTGSGIPTDANVIKVDGTSITISENMDAAGSSVSLTFTGQGVYGAYNSTKDGPATDNDGNALVSGALYFNTTDNEMRAYDGNNWIAASAAANVTVLDYTFNVTTNTTVFSGTATSGGSLSFASVESVDVFLNGIKLIGNLSSGNDYTLDASANSVTLASAAVNGDVVLVRVYKTFAVADAVPASAGGTFSGNVAVTGNIQVDDIVEKTSGHGVEIDGVLIKDGGATVTQITDSNGAESIKITSTSSAVNELTVVNSATGNPPEIQATGDDTNIHLKLTPKGNGGVTAGSIVHATLPAGMIAPFAMATAPSGWLACEGQTLNSVSDTQYASLFSAIGTTWGGSGASSFKVPDLKGAFLRGTGSHGTSTMANGSAFSGPTNVGDFENDQIQKFKLNHNSDSGSFNDSGSGGNGFKFSGSAASTRYAPSYQAEVFNESGFGTPRTGDETRPFNAGVKYCIKY